MLANKQDKEEIVKEITEDWNKIKYFERGDVGRFEKKWSKKLGMTQTKFSYHRQRLGLVVKGKDKPESIVVDIKKKSSDIPFTAGLHRLDKFSFEINVEGVGKEFKDKVEQAVRLCRAELEQYLKGIDKNIIVS